MSEISRANMRLELFLNRVGVETDDLAEIACGRRPRPLPPQDLDQEEGEVLVRFTINRKTGEVKYFWPDDARSDTGTEELKLEKID